MDLRKLTSYAPRDVPDIRIALIVFSLCLVWLVLLSGGKPGYDPDGANALHVAQNIVKGRGIVVNTVSIDDPIPRPRPTITKPPLLPAVIAMLVTLGLPVTLAGLMVSLIACATAAALLYLLARQALPRLPALLVPALFAFQVTTARWGISVHEEALFVALNLAVLWRITELLQRAHPTHWVQYTILGGMVALAMLASYQGLPLLLVVSAYVAWLARRVRRWSPLLAFGAGLAVIAAWPFIRFTRLWLAGIRPGLDVAGDTVFYKMLAGFISAFQNDILGRQFIWLYNGSLSDIVVVSGFYLALGALFVFVFLRSTSLRPLVFYVALYLVILLVQLGGQGKDIYEPRYSMPVYGLLFIFALYAFYKALQHWKKLQPIGLGLGTLAVAFFVYGQANRIPDLLSWHGPLCPAPMTIQWVESHIPEDAVIAAGQCGYELKAASASQYWLPIPPAQDARNDHRWTETDFVTACTNVGARWIVLLTGGKGDPFRDKPGYGPFMDQLFAGQQSDHTVLAATLKDGLVYRIKCDQKMPAKDFHK